MAAHGVVLPTLRVGVRGGTSLETQSYVSWMILGPILLPMSSHHQGVNSVSKRIASAVGLKEQPPLGWDALMVEGRSSAEMLQTCTANGLCFEGATLSCLMVACEHMTKCTITGHVGK